jgi:hypothetical protein
MPRIHGWEAECILEESTDSLRILGIDHAMNAINHFLSRRESHAFFSDAKQARRDLYVPDRGVVFVESKLSNAKEVRRGNRKGFSPPTTILK